MTGLKRPHDGKVAGLYDLDKTLGRGHFAVVKLARHVFTGEKVAVKVIDKTKLDPVARAHLFQEVRCMKMVQHPNVVRLYEVIDTATKLYLILELGDGGDMYDCIMKHDGGLTEELAKCYFAQIVHAISYCHRLHVVHRDLKPENVVFFEKQGVVKLTDFGFSNRFQPGKTLNTSCGSLAYSAPEILLGDEYDAPAVDIWSLGVILFMLVCGQPPFQETNDSETLTMIMDCKYTVPPHISHACRDLIANMLQRDPKKRATLEEIGAHEWLQGVDPSPATKLSTPLVSHRSLSEEEHGSIIQRMVLGGIADRDTITEALESNQYNHITATYFLLAERMLREKQEKEQHSQTRSPSPSKAQFRQSWPTRVDVHQDVSDGLGGPTISHPGGPQSPARSAESLHKGPRPKTALLDLSQRPSSSQQQPARQNQERGLRPLAKPHSNPLRLGSLTSVGPCKTRSPSLFSVEEDEEEEDTFSSLSSLPAQVVLRSKASSSSSMSSSGNRLTSRMSAPVLNQIHEEDKEEEEEEERRELHGFGPPKPSLSLILNPRVPSPTALVSSPNTVSVRAPVAAFTPSSETSDDETESHHKPHTATEGGEGEERDEGDEGNEGGEKKESGQDSPGSGAGQGKGTAKAASGLVESLKLMSLCLSSQFHSLTGGGGGGGGGGSAGVVAGDTQDRPMWRMCMGGSTGSLDKVSLLGGPSPRGNLYYHQPPLGDALADPLLDGSCTGTLRLGELDLARENHRNMKNRVLQMPLSDKTLSVNIHRSPKEGLLCTPTPHSCCQVI
ncbi:SNF-related serine/threonine-protein kinase [Cottoperca gobio]|uniref:SNF-related serine/threonine-protein kinase n=1 Tax=Cottoperca gobio TaxID=56716 RepID=A0A6J2QNK8_COTGO|nr:SNF-related serine/threonine-protein kinase [Cottoperca gobio]XP_029299340.1 SNF-related serine/threonine-protein kinase [Cottoperca gobio]XP_029299341.1 SNF-related serine/threonine-protein kinase [Cottoperca gobio]